MAAIAFVAPALEGGADALRRFAQEINGPRQGEYHQCLRRHGITVDKWFLQKTPMGEMVIVYLEADDIQKAFQTMMESKEPFDVWFKQAAKEVHGIDFNEPLQGPLSELVHEAQLG